MEIQKAGFAIIFILIGWIIGFLHCDFQWYKANKMTLPTVEKFEKD